MPLPFQNPLDGVSFVEIPVSGSTSNVYVLGPANDALLIDCGAADTAGEVIATLEGHGVAARAVRAILITHGHTDHYGGAGALAAWSGAPVWAHPAAAAEIEDPWAAYISPSSPSSNTEPGEWDRFQAQAGGPVRVERLLREGDAIEHAGRKLQVRHTPGHDRSSIVLFEPDRRLVFVGDVIQGGADASANWLGLFTDAAGQRRSLARLAALQPAWLFKGHRVPRSGADVEADIRSALARLDAIEKALLGALRSQGTLTLAQAARAAFRDVLGMTVAKPPAYALVSVNAFLIDLACRGLVRENDDLGWEVPIA